MTKCLIIETFSGPNCHGVAGQTVEMPEDDAKRFEFVGFVKILPKDQQPKPAMAFEIAKAAKAETETPEVPKVIKKPEPPKVIKKPEPPKKKKR